jgi:predicted glycogen debranching enzyme
MSMPVDDIHEWVEGDGSRIVASGTVGGVRTRRSQALLSVGGPAGARVVLVNGFDAWVETPNGQYAISTQRYAPDVMYPDGALRVASFRLAPWPEWRYRLEDGTAMTQEIFVPTHTPAVALAWRIDDPQPGTRLLLRPFLSGRAEDALHRENPAFAHDPETAGGVLVWRPYRGIPAIRSAANAAFSADPSWYRNFLYTEDQAHGHECTEDLASPGVLVWDLSAGEAVWVLTSDAGAVESGADPCELVASWRAAERRARSEC